MIGKADEQTASGKAKKHKNGKPRQTPFVDIAPCHQHHQRTEQGHRRVQPAKAGVGEVEGGFNRVTMERDKKSVSKIGKPHHGETEKQKPEMLA